MDTDVLIINLLIVDIKTEMFKIKIVLKIFRTDRYLLFWCSTWGTLKGFDFQNVLCTYFLKIVSF